MGVFGLSRAFGWSIGPFIGGFLLDGLMEEGLILWGIVALIGVSAAIGYLALERTIFKNGKRGTADQCEMYDQQQAVGDTRL
jgi:MFS family permease